MSANPLNAYVLPTIPGVRLVPFVADAPQEGKRLFQELPAGSFMHLFVRAPILAAADIVVVPHEYAALKKHGAYLDDALRAAREERKKLLISAYQDSTLPIDIPDAYILRPSVYRRTLRPNDIIMPAYVEDLGAVYGHAPLPKSEKPMLGFVGKAGVVGLRGTLRYALRNHLLRHGADREGTYFRRRALALLAKDSRIALTSIVRSGYSGHANSIELPPEEARREYVDSMRNNLFTLAPRGDGNYSLRFYETLSMGRIPILLDTDMVLPLEDRIAYDRFILRIPWQELHALPERIVAFFESHTNEELTDMQRRAREVFEQHLYMPAFLRQALTQENLRL